jgi:hypothetical protein
LKYRDPDSVGKKFLNESEVQSYTLARLRSFCSKVWPEHIFPVVERYRVDAAGIFLGTRMVYCECKHFTEYQSYSSIVDAIDQASSYADAMQHPMFIGPVFTSLTNVMSGCGDGLAALQLLAGRFNVGFLWVLRRSKRCGLILRGQNLIDNSMRVHGKINDLYVYRKRSGSKTASQEVLAL